MKGIINGGSGQISSHMAKMFLARCEEVVVVDTLATG
jgi:UDP-glucose 4-epimerase